MVKVCCPACRRFMPVPVHYLGNEVTCASCGTSFVAANPLPYHRRPSWLFPLIGTVIVVVGLLVGGVIYLSTPYKLSESQLKKVDGTGNPGSWLTDARFSVYNGSDKRLVNVTIAILHEESQKVRRFDEECSIEPYSNGTVTIPVGTFLRGVKSNDDWSWMIVDAYASRL